MLEKIIRSTEDCEKLGFYISQKIHRGDVISLKGELGSGKTTFVKGILKGLLNQEIGKSPLKIINCIVIQSLLLMKVTLVKEIWMMKSKNGLTPRE